MLGKIKEEASQHAHRSEARSMVLAVLALQELFGLHRRSASGARRSDRLLEYTVLHVTARVDAGYVCANALAGEQITFRIHFELCAEQAGVGDVADGDENCGHR